MPALCPKLILEGTRLTHKTDLAFALNEHPVVTGRRRYRYHCPLVSAEWGGFSNEPWGRGLVNFDASEEALALEAYATWARLEVSGNPRQYDELEPFIAEQHAMRELTARSALPSIVLDLTDDDVVAAANRVAAWLEDTGGLYAPA